jgi:hypothetical protein
MLEDVEGPKESALTRLIAKAVKVMSRFPFYAGVGPGAIRK